MRPPSTWLPVFCLLLVSACYSPSQKWSYHSTVNLEELKPIGIASADHRFWISDAGHNRVVRISQQGEILDKVPEFQRPMHLSFHKKTLYIPEFLTDTIYLLKEGIVSVYPVEEQMDGPAAVDIQGKKVAIADFYNHRVIFKEGKKRTLVGKKGHKKGQLFYPTDVELYDGYIYVADAYNHRVQVFNEQGESLQMIGNRDSLQVASGIAVTPSFIAITSQESDKVFIYNHNGQWQQTLDHHLEAPTEVMHHQDTLYIVNFLGQSFAKYRLQ